MVRKETAAHQVSNILAIHEVRLTGLYRIFFCFFHVFPIVIEMVRKETAAHQVSNTSAIYEVRLTGLYRIFFCFLHVFPIVIEGAIVNFPHHRVIFFEHFSNIRSQTYRSVSYILLLFTCLPYSE